MKARDARILLTGASGGIGKAAAVALVKSGASLLLVGRSAAGLIAQERELSQTSGAMRPGLASYATDLTRPPEIKALSEIAADWGVNVLIHGAGLPSFGRLESIGDMKQVLDTNLLAQMMLTQALLPHLRSIRKAQVLCVGSALGRIGLPGFSVYCASKFGLRGFAEALRRELAETSVRVQYLGPRSTRTTFNDAGVDAHNRATGTATDSPELVARAIVKMLENEAAERFLGFPEKLAVRLNGLDPAFIDPTLARHRRHLPEPTGLAVAAPAMRSPRSP
jgi:short-subunit dehydrogenase